MPCLEQNKGDDDMNWKKIMLYNDEKLRKKNGLLKDKIEETINQLNVLVMTHDLMLRGDLPRVNVYLNLDGSDSIRVANGFQETLYGGVRS